MIQTDRQTWQRGIETNINRQVDHKQINRCWERDHLIGWLKFINSLKRESNVRTKAKNFWNDYVTGLSRWLQINEVKARRSLQNYSNNNNSLVKTVINLC